MAIYIILFYNQVSSNSRRIIQYDINYNRLSNGITKSYK